MMMMMIMLSIVTAQVCIPDCLNLVERETDLSAHCGVLVSEFEANAKTESVPNDLKRGIIHTWPLTRDLPRHCFI